MMHMECSSHQGVPAAATRARGADGRCSGTWVLVAVVAAELGIRHPDHATRSWARWRAMWSWGRRWCPPTTPSARLRRPGARRERRHPFTTGPRDRPVAPDGDRGRLRVLIRSAGPPHPRVPRRVGAAAERDGAVNVQGERTIATREDASRDTQRGFANVAACHVATAHVGPRRGTSPKAPSPGAPDPFALEQQVVPLITAAADDAESCARQGWWTRCRPSSPAAAGHEWGHSPRATSRATATSLCTAPCSTSTVPPDPPTSRSWATRRRSPATRTARRHRRHRLHRDPDRVTTSTDAAPSTTSPRCSPRSGIGLLPF